MQRLTGLLLAMALLAMSAPAFTEAAEVERLEQEVAELRARLERLEALLEAQTAADGDLEAAPADRRDDSDPEARALLRVDDPDSGRPLVIERSVLEEAIIGAERVEEQRQADAGERARDVQIGGALRFNHFFREDISDSRVRRGESGFDLFRLNVDGAVQNVLISAEYRHTPDLDTIRYGWIGYQFDNQDRIKLGIHQVPFGLLPFAAHNYWFGVPHYAGFADNHDLGLAWEGSRGPWDMHLAFYKNEELGNAGSLSRYAPDLVFTGDPDQGQNEDINRLNARLAYVMGRETGCEHEFGLSGQYGELYNPVTERRGDHWAAAGHLDSRCGRWNVQLQGIRYDYDPANPEGVNDDVVQLGALGASYGLAATGTIATANLAYNFEPPLPVLDQVICYNNYSRLFKDAGGGRDSQINTLGCGVGLGPLFTYVDLILARNMIFLGDGSLADGGEGRWRSRFNINVGYYW